MRSPLSPILTARDWFDIDEASVHGLVRHETIDGISYRSIGTQEMRVRGDNRQRYGQRTSAHWTDRMRKRVLRVWPSLTMNTRAE